MAIVQARYLKQFNALDSMLSKMQSTSTYLTQQLSKLSG
jgi:flagellar hook-associated protein 2